MHALAAVLIAIACIALAGCSVVLPPSFAPEKDRILKNGTPDDGALTVRYFGVSTLFIKAGQTSIMIDGFFSRPALLSLALPIKPDREIIKTTLREAGITKVDALLVAHSHYDHALDVPVVARETQAVVYGSESTANIARGADLPESQIRVLRPAETLSIGDSVTVKVFTTPHACRHNLIPGKIEKPLRGPVTLWDYKLGEAYSFLIEYEGRKVLIVPSANVEANTFDGITADVVFLAIGELTERSRRFIEFYWREVVERTRPNLVIPIHWDDFVRRSLDKPLAALPRGIDDVKETMGEIDRLASGKVAVKFMPLSMAVVLPLGKDHGIAREPGKLSPIPLSKSDLCGKFIWAADLPPLDAGAASLP